MQSLKQGISLIFGRWERQHIRDGDDEIRHDECTPEAHNHANEASHKAFLKEVTVADGGQCDDNVPHAIAQLIEVLIGDLRKRALENLQSVTEHYNGCYQGDQDGCVRALIHVGFHGEGKIGLAIVHKAHTLRAWRHKRGDDQGAPHQQVGSDKASTQEDIVDAVIDVYVVGLDILCIREILKVWVGRQQHQDNLKSHGLPPTSSD